MKFSLITLVSNRETHLKNLLKAVRWNSLQPSEVLIVNMGEKPDLNEFEDLPLRLLDLRKSSGDQLPLAAARNVGARSANYEVLCFLDVDCVPSSAYFETMLNAYGKHERIIMGTPHYLTRSLPENFSFKDLKTLSIPHPHRPVVDVPQYCEDGGMFWSLCFITGKSDFLNHGGFDERFLGYGGEDTDFGFSLCKQGDGFYIADAVVYHQQHAVYSPPVHKLNEIVENCRLFYKKWGIWPMGAWLEAFEKYDLIEWNNNASNIRIKQHPDKKLLEACFKPDAPFM